MNISNKYFKDKIFYRSLKEILNYIIEMIYSIFKIYTLFDILFNSNM
jgi:hypothetical protein